MTLTALGIKKAGDGKGLELHKKGANGKWIYRYSCNCKRRQMGLGTWPTVSLAEARKERDRWALRLAQGQDPIAERNAQNAAIKEQQAKRDPTLQELAEEAFESYKPTLRQGGSSARWLSPLKLHIFPKIGRKPVSTIQPEDIRSTLSPIWITKHPTAEKAIQRLRKIFTTGKLRGLDCDPFKIDVAQDLLGPVHHKTTPTPATDWRDIPELYRWLEGKSASASCLQFMILTLVRTHGCRAARFGEFHGDVWTVPAERVKGRVKTVKASVCRCLRKLQRSLNAVGNSVVNWCFGVPPV
jgi:Arm DNA-binding domain/Phage integrase central domain